MEKTLSNLFDDLAGVDTVVFPCFGYELDGIDDNDFGNKPCSFIQNQVKVVLGEE